MKAATLFLFLALSATLALTLLFPPTPQYPGEPRQGFPRSSEFGDIVLRGGFLPENFILKGRRVGLEPFSSRFPITISRKLVVESAVIFDNLGRKIFTSTKMAISPDFKLAAWTEGIVSANGYGANIGSYRQGEIWREDKQLHIEPETR